MRIGRLVIDITPLRTSRDFRWLFGGRFVSLAGNAVALTAANWQIYALTRSSLAVGLLSLGAPASTAATPALVGPSQLAAAVALNSMSDQLGSLGGPVIAGYLIAGPGLAACYGADAVGFAVFGAAMLFVRPLPAVRAQRPGLQSLREGLRYVRRSPGVGGMLLIDTNAMIFGMPTALFPALAREHFHGGSATFGLLAASLQPAFRAAQRDIAKPPVQAAPRLGREHLPDAAYGRMIGSGLDQEHAQAVTAMRRIDEHVAQPGEGRLVGHEPRESDLRSLRRIEPDDQ